MTFSPSWLGDVFTFAVNVSGAGRAGDRSLATVVGSSTGEVATSAAIVRDGNDLAFEGIFGLVVDV